MTMKKAELAKYYSEHAPAQLAWLEEERKRLEKLRKKNKDEVTSPPVDVDELHPNETEEGSSPSPAPLEVKKEDDPYLQEVLEIK